MSESMVAQVEKAIAEAQARGFNGPRTLARAAIAAMREPTQAMVNAGRQVPDDDSPYASPWRTWPVMIDAALSTSDTGNAA